MPRPRTRRRGGLVLLELLAYIVLLGVLAGGVAVSSRAVRSGGGVERIESRLAWLDAAARRASEQGIGSIVLTFDLAKQEARLRIGGLGDDGPYRADWPEHLRLEQVWVGGREAALGEVAVRYGENGMSPDFGLEFYDRRKAEARWLLVAGGSGQFVAMGDRSRMREVFDVR